MKTNESSIDNRHAVISSPENTFWKVFDYGKIHFPGFDNCFRFSSLRILFLNRAKKRAGWLTQPISQKLDGCRGTRGDVPSLNRRPDIMF